MRVFAAVILVLSMFCGCTAKDDALKQATDLRTELLTFEKCCFQAAITADYGDNIHTFQMDCTVDAEGCLSFTVTDPQTISGITGHIAEDEAALTFDDKVLAFPMLADGQISPISSPWLFLNSLRGGYLSGVSEESEGLCIYIDDSFHEYPLQLEVYTDQDVVPTHAEFIWQNSRIISLDIRNFLIQ